MARKAKIEIFPGVESNSHYLRVRAANGEVIADGAEAYDSKGNAKKAAKRLVLAVASAEIVESEA